MFPELRFDPPSILGRVSSVWMDIFGKDLAVRLLTPGIKPLILATQDGFDTDRGVVDWRVLPFVDY
jgi:hypothetical protein